MVTRQVRYVKRQFVGVKKFMVRVSVRAYGQGFGSGFRGSEFRVKV